MADIDAIFKAYDIRGVYPDQMDAELVQRIGAGFARFLIDEDSSITEIVVARDMRPSGPELVAAFTEGVTGQGLNVIDIGLGSTDMMYFASGALKIPGAVFTASHNPAQYQGIKMCRPAAAPIGGDTGLDVIKAHAAAGLSPTGQPGTSSERNMLDDFAKHVLSFIDVSKVRPLKIVADTANGMGGLVVPAVFASLPCEIEIMYEELDGTFPNHEANPLDMENLRDLQARVLEVGADVGLAFDGDADRVFLVDEKAQPISGSLTTAMVAASMLDKNSGATIIHNLICSKAVPEVVEGKGGTAVRSRVGHSYIKKLMAETGAIFGGEHSGHYYFRDNFRADSGLIATMFILELLSEANKPLSEVVAPFDLYSASGEINTTVADQAAVIAKVKELHADATMDELDGLTVDHGDWWFNLRASNTEPLLRLNLEAPTEADVAARVAEVQSQMQS